MTRKFSSGRRSRTPSGDKGGASPLEAITRLIEDRDKYEQWLDDLEAKKDSTPDKVFERVRQDYLTRLQAVMDELKTHTVALQEHAANLVAKLRESESTEQEITDELAEAELRAQVGEITEAEWEATSRKAQREVAKLKENQEVIADELIKIRDILSDDDDDEEEEEAPRTSADFDELEFLKSVVGPAGATPASSPKVARPAAPAPPAPSTSSTQPIKRATPPGGAPPAARQTPTGTAAYPASGARTTPSGSPAAAPKAAAPAKPAEPPKQSEPPDNALGIRPSDVAEQPKTLKCPECGTMNYPNEWYCERCGAELAQI
jgi:hypothetical protein